MLGSVKLLSAICRFVDEVEQDAPSHPVMAVVREAWPVISSTFERYCTDAEIIASLCQLVGNFMRACKLHFMEFLLPLQALLCATFQASQFAQVLGAAETAMRLCNFVGGDVLGDVSPYGTVLQPRAFWMLC